MPEIPNKSPRAHVVRCMHSFDGLVDPVKCMRVRSSLCIMAVRKNIYVRCDVEEQIALTTSVMLFGSRHTENDRQ